MENNKNKKSVKFQGDMLNFCDFIQVFVFTTNHHLKDEKIKIVEVVDSVEPDEVAHHEPPHLDLHCMSSTL